MPWFRRRSSANQVASPPKRSASRYWWIGEKRFMKGEPYMLPDGIEERERLNLQHYMFRVIMQGQLYAAPTANPLAVLDVATGTAVWAIDMAKLFPNANIMAIDIREPDSISPYTLTKPINYHFQIADVTIALPFLDNSFDLVHQRLLIAALEKQRWPAAVRELARVTMPGGWVELTEVHVAQPPAGARYYSQAMDDVNTWIRTAALRRDIDFDQAYKLENHLRAAGLKNIRSFRLEIPFGGNERMGKLMASDYWQMAAHMQPLVELYKIASPSDYERNLVQAKQDLAENPYVTPIFIAYGQKS